jgi:hypothetical protein
LELLLIAYNLFLLVQILRLTPSFMLFFFQVFPCTKQIGSRDKASGIARREYPPAQ